MMAFLGSAMVQWCRADVMVCDGVVALADG
jgi:hypothetical protein